MIISMSCALLFSSFLFIPQDDKSVVFSGKVQDVWENNPIGDVEVILFGYSNDEQFVELGRTQTTATGSFEWHFSPTEVSPDKRKTYTAYSVRVRHPGYLWVREWLSLIYPPKELYFDLRLRVGTTVSGRVIDSEGQPVMGARIALYTHDGLELAYGASDEKGAYSLDLYSDRGRRLRASAQSKGTASVLVDHRVGDTSTFPELVLKEEARVQGRLLFPDGSPVANELVQVYSRRLLKERPDLMLRAMLYFYHKEFWSPPFDELQAIEGAACGSVRSATTDSDGGFVITGLERDAYFIHSPCFSSSRWLDPAFLSTDDPVEITSSLCRVSISVRGPAGYEKRLEQETIPDGFLRVFWSTRGPNGVEVADLSRQAVRDLEIPVLWLETGTYFVTTRLPGIVANSYMVEKKFRVKPGDSQLHVELEPIDDSKLLTGQLLVTTRAGELIPYHLLTPLTAQSLEYATVDFGRLSDTFLTAPAGDLLLDAGPWLAPITVLPSERKLVEVPDEPRGGLLHVFFGEARGNVANLLTDDKIPEDLKKGALGCRATLAGKKLGPAVGVRFLPPEETWIRRLTEGGAPPLNDRRIFLPGENALVCLEKGAVPPGDYVLSVHGPCYEPIQVEVQIVRGEVTEIRLPSPTLRQGVRDDGRK